MMFRALAVSLVWMLSPATAQAQDADDDFFLEIFETKRAACESGDAESCFLLGFKFERGYPTNNPVIDIDLVRAAALYRRACDAGYISGCVFAAFMYIEGNGVTQDYGRAAEYAQRGCDLGNAPSCADLGVLYNTGQGVAQSHSRAAALWRQACRGGITSSCANLGYMYGSGDGVVQNYVRAHALFNVSAALGDDTARSNRDIIARLMTPQQIAEAQALARRCMEEGMEDCL